MKDAPPERALGPAQPPEAKDAGEMAKRQGIGVTFGGSASTKPGRNLLVFFRRPMVSEGTEAAAAEDTPSSR